MSGNFQLAPAIGALRFHDAQPEVLLRIPNERWPALLARTDHARLTLALGMRCCEWLPPFVRERIERNLARNAERHRRLRREYDRIAAVFAERGIEFVVLKGATHWPYFCEDPDHRPQYDFDFWCSQDRLLAARQAAEELGFECLKGRRDGPTDHLPTMIRRTGWRWRSDYFDPEMPPSLEIHFRLWNAAIEGIAASGPERFWARRSVREVGGTHIPSLNPCDTLSYASLHVLRHLLRGNPCPYHVYELAHFLERSSQDAPFWTAWTATTPDSLRSLAAIAFHLAREWFHCKWHPSIEQAVDARVDNWLHRFAFSSVQDTPNRDELWLHLALVRDWRARRDILVRRLLPRPARPSLAPHVRCDTALWKARQRWYEARFLFGCGVHHVRALLGSAFRAARSSASQISR
jgi:hypothetical protein